MSILLAGGVPVLYGGTLIASNPPVSMPTNTVAPVVSGNEQEGSTLSCTTGSWTNTPTSYTYQWQRNTGGGFSNISAATGATYILAGADISATIRCQVVATNGVGSSSAVNSNTTGAIASAPITTRGQRSASTYPGPTESDTNFLSPWGYQLAPTGSGTVKIISPTGTPTGAGTLGDPLDVVTAVDTAVAGDTLLMRGGVYRVTVKGGFGTGNTVASWPSGTATDKIKLSRYGTEQPIVSGGDLLGGWTPCVNQADALGNPNWASMYKTTVASHPLGADAGLVFNLHQSNVAMYLNCNGAGFGTDTDEMFYYDNVTKYYVEGADHTAVYNGDGTITITSATAFGGFSNAGDLEGFWVCWKNSQGNSSSKSRITTFNPATDSITFATNGGDFYNGGFIIYGHPKLVNAVGQWGFKEEVSGWTVYCWPWNTGAMNEIEYSVRQWGVNWAQASHWVFYGLNVGQQYSSGSAGGGCLGHPYGSPQGVNGIVIEECRTYALASLLPQYGTALELNGGDGNSIFNCTSYRSQGKTSRCGSQTNLYVSHCLFDGSASTAAQWQGIVGGVCAFTDILNVKGVHGNGMSVYLYSHNVLLHGLKIRTGVGYGLVHQWSTNIYMLFVDVQCPEQQSSAAIQNNSTIAAGTVGELVAINCTMGPWPTTPDNTTQKLGSANYPVGKTADATVRNVLINCVGYGGLYPNNLTISPFLSNIRCGTNSVQSASTAAPWDGTGGNLYVQNMGAQVFTDYPNEDYTPLTSGVLDGTGVDASAYLPSGTWLQGHNLNRDIDGNAVNWGGVVSIGAYQ